MSTASADTSWTTTGTKAFTGLVNATDLGALPLNTAIQVTVALGLHNQAGLNSYIQSINTPGNALYEQSLTPDQFTATYGPTSSEVQAVVNYLATNGFTNISTSSNNLLVTATGLAAQVESAFNTSLEQYQQAGHTVYANTTAAQVPAALGGTVVAVLGLNNAAHFNLPISTPSPTSASLPNYPAAYTPQGFWKAYDVATVPAAKNTSIAIFAEGDLSGVITDLRTEEAANNLPQVPVTVEPTGIASPDTAGADEWDMDTQYSTGMAGTVSHLYIYDATSLTDSDIALEFNKFAAQDLAKAGSASFGEGEYNTYLDGSMLVDDEIFAEAAAQGQTVFASAGDTGGFSAVAPTNGVPAGAPDVNYPASSPYVVAVGGTTLLTNSDGSYNSEIAWLAGGSGTSEFESQPFWQSGIVPATTFKGVPDISMDADPNSGAVVYVNGSPLIFGGTSLSSPLALGAWARFETTHQNKLGFAAPRFYGAYQTAGFHDIVLGDTGPYPAAPGWDYATGLGTIDVSQMNTFIEPGFVATTPKK